jgi:hypothetical protein
MEGEMRRLMSVFGMVYLIGIAVQIWPLVETQWDTVPASRLVASVADRLPTAVTWPIRAWDRTRDMFARADLTTTR